MFKVAAIAILGVGLYLMFFAPAKAKENPVENPSELRLQALKLKHLDEKQVTGVWVLSPRSTMILEPNRSITGRRSSLSLESWGGGYAQFNIGDYKASGPIAWHVKPTQTGTATLHLDGQAGEFELKFSPFKSEMCLVCEVPHPQTGKPVVIRFLKTNDEPTSNSLPF